MRILLLCQFFDPEPAFKGLAFARELMQRGHSVQVLTGLPNYPGGRLYPGYTVRPWQRESLGGVAVFRVPLYPNHDKSTVRRIVNYASFALSAATIGACGIQQPDVVYVYHPPSTIALPSTILRWLRRAPIVADIQDLWPDTVLETGMLHNRAAIAMLKWWCGFAFRQMDHVVVQSPGFKRELVRRGIPEYKIEVIYNWCDEGALRQQGVDDSGSRQLERNGRFKIVFAGTMGMQQGLYSVLEAALLCQQNLPQVQFVFVGGGVERDGLEDAARRMALSNTCFLPRQPAEKMGPILSMADVLLVHLRDLPLFKITIPSKTQAYLAAGRPVLMAVRGDSADLVLKSNSGLCCEPEQPVALFNSVKEFLSMSDQQRKQLGENGALFYEQNLSFKQGVDRFERVFEQALTAKRRMAPSGKAFVEPR
jgi:colanic acid biosynthesis glycosyl transferase WcaI